MATVLFATAAVGVALEDCPHFLLRQLSKILGFIGDHQKLKELELIKNEQTHE